MTRAVVNDVALTVVGLDPLVEHLQVLAAGGSEQATISLAVKKWRIPAGASVLELFATLEGSDDLGNWDPFAGGPHLSLNSNGGAASESAPVVVGSRRYLRVQYMVASDNEDGGETGSVLFSSVLTVIPKG